MTDVPAPPITLLTDFGHRDHYVGVMHGVILGIAPCARIVDLTHDIPPQAIADAAFLLDAAAPYFPWGTIHVAIVDPGVGTERRILCARTSRATYLAPDNGLLARVLERDPPARLFSVENAHYFLERVSDTFHGRDIFAPVAAHLANGLDPRKLGPEVASIRPLALPRLLDEGKGVLRGEVIHVDHFGNLITSLRGEAAGRLVSARIGGTDIPGPVARSYAERHAGEALLIRGSSGFVEVAVNQASAASRYGVRRGEPIEFRLSPPPEAEDLEE